MNGIKKAILTAGAALAIAGGITLASSVYTIQETQHTVVTYQGNVEKVYVGSFDADAADESRIEEIRKWADENGYQDVEIYSTEKGGLYFKIPFLERVERIPDQILEFNADPEKAQTRDKRQVTLDYYVKWYVDNPLDFYLSCGSIVNGNSRIDDSVYRTVRNHVGAYDFNENIRSSDREVMALDGIVQLESVEYGRENIQYDIVEEANANLEQYGIKVVDIRFIRVELPEQNEQSVYERMQAERNRIASLYRAEGDALDREIRANADRDVAITRANSQQEAGMIRGEGESEAAKIYTGASSEDPEFFEFWRTLKAYETAFDGDGETRLIMESDTDFYKFLEGY